MRGQQRAKAIEDANNARFKPEPKEEEKDEGSDDKAVSESSWETDYGSITAPDPEIVANLAAEARARTQAHDRAVITALAEDITACSLNDDDLYSAW